VAGKGLKAALFSVACECAVRVANKGLRGGMDGMSRVGSAGLAKERGEGLTQRGGVHRGTAGMALASVSPPRRKGQDYIT